MLQNFLEEITSFMWRDKVVNTSANLMLACRNDISNRYCVVGHCTPSTLSMNN